MNAPISKDEWAQLRRESLDAIPELVTEAGLPSVLLPYQARSVGLLDGTAMARVLVIEKSRRVGLTWGLASYAVLRAARDRQSGGMDVMYISYSQEMTREFIDACGMWARSFAMAAAETEEFLFDAGDDDGDLAIKAFRIQFASGFEVIALSSAPRSLRGKQGVVIIDEAAFVDNLSELLKAALAFLMWGGQVVVCSTHNGADHPFNALVQDVLGGRLPYKHLQIDFDQALREGLFRRICLVRGQDWTPEAEADWRQEIIDFYGEGADEELFCIPALGSGAWLPAPLIEARMTADAPLIQLTLPRDFLHKTQDERAELLRPFIQEIAVALAGLTTDPAQHFAAGFDFARVADLSVLSLLAIEKNMKRREALTIEMRGVPGDEQKTIVAEVLGAVREKLVGAAFDATGMGWTVAEDMGRRFGFRENEDSPGLIWAIKFTEDWYRLHMPPLKTAFEDDMISIGRDDDHLSDLRAVKVVRGTPRVPPAREGAKGLKRHGDYAIALALAHFASRMRWVEYSYRAAGAPQTQAPGRMAMEPPQEDRPDRPWWRSPLGMGLRGRM